MLTGSWGKRNLIALGGKRGGELAGKTGRAIKYIEVQYDVYEYGRSSICIAWRTSCCGVLVYVSTQIT